MKLRPAYFCMLATLTLSAALMGQTPTSEEPKSNKWSAEVPLQVREPKPWAQLLEKLMDNELYYSALATSARMLLLFSDLPTKELAYKTVIQLIDKGYPYSTQSLFLSGDIQPHDEYDFVNSYNLYKAILNQEKGMQRWAENYFGQLDKANFPKYLFFEALMAYGKGDLTKTEELLRKVLAKEFPKEQLPFVRKVTRTLARLYFDKSQYEKSLDIYQSFLLRLNPITPSDWLEAAWNLYHLKRYPEALGMLYNLESEVTELTINLERYIIRALIYRNTCSIPNSDSLIDSFGKDFGVTIDGIKRGEPLSKLTDLKRIKLPITAFYRQISTVLGELRAEREKLGSLSADPAAVAKYVYETEIRMLTQQSRAHEDEALEKAAQQLIMMAEQLKFLRYGVAREKLNPDAVFRAETKDNTIIRETAKDSFVIRWKQLGDYWRDERLFFRGEIANRCTK